MKHATNYRTRTGAIQYKPAFGLLTELIESDLCAGFCLSCAEIADSIEPDAEREHCPNCGAFKVYSAENLLLIGLYFDDDHQADIDEAQAAGFIR